jgi:hypothetical protein
MDERESLAIVVQYRSKGEEAEFPPEKASGTIVSTEPVTWVFAYVLLDISN